MESGIVYSGPCVFRGLLIGTDGVNDPVITVYNGTNNSGDEIVPTCTYDASAMGINGITGLVPGTYCDKGIYVEITCAGSVEVIVNHVPYAMDGILQWRG